MTVPPMIPPLHWHLPEGPYDDRLGYPARCSCGMWVRRSRSGWKVTSTWFARLWVRRYRNLGTQRPEWSELLK